MVKLLPLKLKLMKILIHVQVGNQEIRAHRAVLACASPYLFDLISLGNESQLQRCRLNGEFNREAFSILVEYAYTSK